MNFEMAVDRARSFLAKMKGLDVEFGGRALIDWLDFEVKKTKDTEYQFDLICSFKENIFSDQIVHFYVRIDRIKGEVVDVQRVPQ